MLLFKISFILQLFLQNSLQHMFYHAFNSDDNLVKNQLATEKLHSTFASSLIECQALLLIKYENLLNIGYQFNSETNNCIYLKITLEVVIDLRAKNQISQKSTKGDPIYICGDCELPDPESFKTLLVFRTDSSRSYLIDWKTQSICRVSFPNDPDTNKKPRELYHAFENNGNLQICQGGFDPFPCWLLDTNQQTITNLPTSYYQKYPLHTITKFKKNYNEFWFIGLGDYRIKIGEYHPNKTFSFNKKMPDDVYRFHRSCSVQINSTFGVLAGGFESKKSFLVDIQNQGFTRIGDTINYRRERGCGWFTNTDGTIEVIYFGGFTDDDGVKTHFESEFLSLETKTWRNGPNYPTPTGAITVVQKDGYFYAVGGRGTFSSKNEWPKNIYKFDHRKQWIRMSFDLMDSLIFNQIEISPFSSIACSS